MWFKARETIGIQLEIDDECFISKEDSPQRECIVDVTKPLKGKVLLKTLTREDEEIASVKLIYGSEVRDRFGKLLESHDHYEGTSICYRSCRKITEQNPVIWPFEVQWSDIQFTKSYLGGHFILQNFIRVVVKRNSWFSRPIQMTFRYFQSDISLKRPSNVYFEPKTNPKKKEPPTEYTDLQSLQSVMNWYFIPQITDCFVGVQNKSPLFVYYRASNIIFQLTKHGDVVMLCRLHESNGANGSNALIVSFTIHEGFKLNGKIVLLDLVGLPGLLKYSIQRVEKFKETQEISVLMERTLCPGFVELGRGYDFQEDLTNFVLSPPVRTWGNQEFQMYYQITISFRDIRCGENFFKSYELRSD